MYLASRPVVAAAESSNTARSGSREPAGTASIAAAGDQNKAAKNLKEQPFFFACFECFCSIFLYWRQPAESANVFGDKPTSS